MSNGRVLQPLFLISCPRDPRGPQLDRENRRVRYILLNTDDIVTDYNL